MPIGKEWFKTFSDYKGQIFKSKQKELFSLFGNTALCLKLNKYLHIFIAPESILFPNISYNSAQNSTNRV